MFRFANPEYLYILIFVPILIVFFIYNRKVGKKQLLKLGKLQFVKQMMPEVSESRVWVKFILLVAALTMLVLAVARPQLGMRMRSERSYGIEVVVALDVSNSMLANDVSPTRMEKAKQIVTSLCNRLVDDKIALVVFAGNAFLQMPMSADNVSVGMFLDNINSGMIPMQGTSIAEALSVSSKSFSQQKDVKRAVVVITDGEDHEGGVDEVLDELKANGIKVFVMGVGSTEGSKLLINGEYMLDSEGNEVVTRLNESMCKEIATKANGTYIHIDDSNAAQDKLVDDLNTLQKTQLESDMYGDYYELFPWIALIALILLAVEIIIQPQRSHYFDSWNLFGNRSSKSKLQGRKQFGNGAKMSILVLCILFSFASCMHSPTKVMTQKGNNAFDKHQDSLALINYNLATALDSTNSKASFNLGNTYLRLEKPAEATTSFERTSKIAESPIIKARSYHNIGLILQLSQKYDEAIKAYKESLRADPQNDNTRYNLALCQYLKDKIQPQSQQNQQDNKNQDKDKQEQNKDQQKQNKDNQNKDKDNQDKDKQKQQDKQDNQKQNSGSKNQDISKENAEQMLRAAQFKERETQDKLHKNQIPITRRQLEKNW